MSLIKGEIQVKSTRSLRDRDDRRSSPKGVYESRIQSITIRDSINKDDRKIIKKEIKHPKSHCMKQTPQKKDKKEMSRGIRFKRNHLPGFESSYYKDVNIVKRSHELPVPKSILRK